jgi:hypothetical protein
MEQLTAASCFAGVHHENVKQPDHPSWEVWEQGQTIVGSLTVLLCKDATYRPSKISQRHCTAT